VCLIADVTGFSGMTDVLAGHGLHGSEVLANGMRQVFDPMIQSVIEFGGYVAGFAGDAITALFPVKESAGEAYTRAIASALRMQAYRLKNADFVTPYGHFNISVKIGLGAGEARWRIVAAADGKRATYYFHGSAVDEAVSSLSLSGSGEIILCPLAEQTLGEALKGVQMGERILLAEFSGTAPVPAPIDLPVPNPEHLQVFCSLKISARTTWPANFARLSTCSLAYSLAVTGRYIWSHSCKRYFPCKTGMAVCSAAWILAIKAQTCSCSGARRWPGKMTSRGL
jgi:class 3 adenylate cyclase